MVVIKSQVAGMALELYDNMAGQLAPVVKSQPGFISHVAYEIPGGMELVEVWESREQADAWYVSTIHPAAAAAGLKPSWQYIEAHNLIAR